jgi:copper oxidase (laccase) domain-containing protein
MCPAMLPVTIKGVTRWSEPCTPGDENRHDVLGRNEEELKEWQSGLARKAVWLKRTHKQSVADARENYAAYRCHCGDCTKKKS